MTPPQLVAFVALVITLFTGLVVGFVTGYRAGRKDRRDLDSQASQPLIAWGDHEE